MFSKIKNEPILRFVVVSLILVICTFLLLSVLNGIGAMGKKETDILYDVMVGWVVGVIGGISVLSLYPPNK